MDQLHHVFFAEANELVAEMEKDLLKLEGDPSNKESIASVFRAMHTIKGSAGMFGFDSINAITHQLETIYDSIRTGKSQLSAEVLKVSFEVLDHLHGLLADPKMENPAIQQDQQKLLKEIEALVGASSKPVDAAKPVEETVVKKKVYYIHFLPNENVLKNGTNTVYLVDDLLTLGSGVAFPYFKNLPAFEEVNPQANYTGFEIILETDKPESQIKDVFMFVESDCELDIKVITDEADLTETLRQKFSEPRNINTPRGFEFFGQFLKPEDKSENTRQPEKDIIAKNKVTTSSIRVTSERIDELMNLVSELVTMQASLSLQSVNLDSPELVLISENIEKITRRLRDNAFTMSLIPVESLVVRFQRLVRDLSKELGKEIIFKSEGVETEIDKAIIEKLTDPLLHILRNSLDHGIEMPDERVKKGKPRQGTLFLKAYYSGANVIIEIQDDGAGINLEKVKAKAIKNGLITADEILDEAALLKLIFAPGFSTAEQVTGVSGRGVGMDVVNRNINDLRGDISIVTKKDQGTTFTLTLPLTLSIIDGLLVKVGETEFIIPLSLVNKCYEAETNYLETVFNQWITLDGERTPFLYLRREFGIEKDRPVLSQVIKVAHNKGFVGLAVDRIVGEYQAVLKPLGQFYHEQDEFSGASILGDGSVALVIDTNKLIRKLIDDTKIE